EAPRARVEADRLAQMRALADRTLERDLGAQRAGGDAGDALGRGAVGARLEGEGIDVPRVPVDRAVLVELEAVAGRGERLAAGRAVDERGDRAAGRQRGAQVRV